METIKEEKSEGLTLVELMVALAIFGLIVTGIIFYLMRTAQYTGRRIDVAVNVQQGTRAAIEQLTRELRMAGYRKTSTLAVHNGANATFIEFEADINGDDAPERIAYLFTNNTLQRRVSTATSGTITTNCGAATLTELNVSTWGPWVTLADNVVNFSLSYFTTTAPTTPISTPTCTDLQVLSSVQIDLEARVDNPYPGAQAPVSVRLRSHVQTRNSGIFGGCESATPPATPTGLAVTDTCLCTRLTLNWTPNTELDLAGYVIMVGRVPGLYGTPIEVGKISSYTIDQNNMNLVPDVRYYIAIAAFNTCRITSPALEVSVDGTGCGAATDTRPSPTLPEAIDIASVTATSSVGSVTLNWGAVLRGGAIRDDLNGYRIYRSPTGNPGTYTCVNCDPSVSNSVTVPFASERTSYTYTDSSADLMGCNIYYYQIAPVNCRGEGPHTADIHGDGGGPQTDFPSGANTAPQDITPPADPVPFVASPGSDEVYLTFTTPNDADFYGVLILYSTAGWPPESVNGQQPSGNVAYSQTGLLRNNTTTFRHTGLTNGTHYYYRAYAFDRCNNYSRGTATASDAQPCNDGTSPPYPWYHGTPNAPRLLSLSYCSDKVTLTWEASKGANPLDGTHNDEIPPDLMLYRIYRQDSTGTHMIKEVAASTQAVDSDFDATAFAGTEMRYWLTALDCVPNESAVSNTLSAWPGAVIVDLTRKDQFITRGENHNELFFVIRNTSGKNATVQSMTLTYEQDTAFVKQVDFFTVDGDNPLQYTFEKTAYVDTNVPIDRGSGNEVVFTDLPVLAAQGTFPGLSYRVVKVTFTDSSGTNPAAADMRGIILRAKFKFFLDGNTAGVCEETSAQFTIPTGPQFSGTAQQPPAPSTFLPSTILVGSYIVPGGLETNVETFITTDSGATPITATLRWTVTSTSVLVAPSRPYGNSIPMIDLGGNQFILFNPVTSSGSRIPANDGNRVWYYIDASDVKNNISTTPSITSQAYTYDQAIIDPCTTTPKNPASLNATVACGAFVRLSWSPVTQNTDNTAITDLAGYRIRRYTDPLFTILEATFTVGPTTLTYDDSISTAVNHYYKVTAFDTCSPPKESAIATAPSVTSPIAGGAGSPTVTATPSSVFPFISGQTTADTGVFRVTIVDPTFACNGTSNEVAYAHMCAASGADEDEFRIIEQGDTGVFVLDSAFHGRDYLQAIFSNTPTGGAVGIGVHKSDTITICWNRVTTAGGTGSTCSPCVASNTVSVTPDPCMDTPNAPSGLTGNRGTGTSRMNMSWTAPSTNTDGSLVTDLVGYNIYRRLTTTGTWTLVGQVTTTSVTNYDVGVNLQTGGDFYFSVTAVDSCSPPNESARSNVIGPF